MASLTPHLGWLPAVLIAPTTMRVALGALLAAWLVWAYRRTAGTTLRAPVMWMLAALVVVLTAESLVDRASAVGGTIRYLAAVGSFCPSMALLGAKRPQDRGWQFVVATLWLVLGLPALQSLVFHPHSPLDLHPAWRWFLIVLIGIVVANYLLTRWALPVLLAGAAQWLLLGDQAPLGWRGNAESAVAGALALLLAAATCVSSGWPRRRGDAAAGSGSGSDRVWLAFRDAYGAVWALRVMERINQAAGQAERQERLGWQGFTEHWDPLGDSARDPSDPLAATVRMLLTRFVSTAWIERHAREA
jgi:hypothetical protein